MEPLGRPLGLGRRASAPPRRYSAHHFLSGDIDKAPTKILPIFNFTIPTELPGVDPKILDPRDTYADPKEWYEKADKLAKMFIENFKKFENNAAGKVLVAAGPHID